MNKDIKDKAITVSETLKILAHPKRLYILCLLKTEELNVSQIESLSGMGQSQTSQVLNDLRRQGILSLKKKGKQCLYQLKDPKMASLIEALYQIYCQEEL